MNKPQLPNNLQEQVQLLTDNFLRLNQINKIEIFSLSDNEIIVGVLKQRMNLPGEQEKEIRRMIIKEVKNIYRPFTGNRKIHVHIKWL